MTGSGGSRRFCPAEEAGEEVGSCRATQLSTSALSQHLKSPLASRLRILYLSESHGRIFFLNSRLLNIDEITVNCVHVYPYHSAVGVHVKSEDTLWVLGVRLGWSVCVASLFTY